MQYTGIIEHAAIETWVKWTSQLMTLIKPLNWILRIPSSTQIEVSLIENWKDMKKQLMIIQTKSNLDLPTILKPSIIELTALLSLVSIKRLFVTTLE